MRNTKNQKAKLMIRLIQYSRETVVVITLVFEQKVKQFLETERYNELMQRQELELAIASKTDRDKLLAMLAEQQIVLDEELHKIQREKETERFRLIEQLQEGKQYTYDGQ
ncbi:unnamed protein product [Callosobruchus maculatus]|uniref:Uncharacterized protein n=1 Tax=Callosobruchus maculatus TaxID=64391 RepID=A0A653C2G4_CALMS|nr:unnamed protein product [Callosobruchus maculatus]